MPHMIDLKTDLDDFGLVLDTLFHAANDAEKALNTPDNGMNTFEMQIVLKRVQAARRFHAKHIQDMMEIAAPILRKEARNV